MSSLGVTTSRISLGRAHLLAASAVRELRRAGIRFDSLTLLGSLRRYAPDIRDVALLAVAPRSVHQRLLTAFTNLSLSTRTVQTGDNFATIATERAEVTLFVTESKDAGAALVWHTGSKRHTERLRQRAASLGLEFGDGRLCRTNGESLPTPTEEMLYEYCGLPFIPPELREGDEEIPWADEGRIPRLVTDLDVRGDLHMHSTWSDGRDTVEQMVTMARQLGYAYVAITDHSERSFASRKLSAADVPRQRDEILALRERTRGIHILHGVEVDIMHDGSLDFDDALLEGFDIVLASLHDHGGHDRRKLTERYLRAIRHPLVNIITHPANRSPAQSPGYDLDFDALFAAAAETGTAMEVDGAPGHLDMDGALARRAAAAGVTITVDSDCHRAEALGRQMRFAIGTARRGWLEPRHVLNTRDVDAVREFVASKRAAR